MAMMCQPYATAVRQKQLVRSEVLVARQSQTRLYLLIRYLKDAQAKVVLECFLYQGTAKQFQQYAAMHYHVAFYSAGIRALFNRTTRY